LTATSENFVEIPLFIERGDCMECAGKMGTNHTVHTLDNTTDYGNVPGGVIDSLAI